MSEKFILLNGKYDCPLHGESAISVAKEGDRTSHDDKVIGAASNNALVHGKRR